MTKFFKNLYRLLLVGTPFFIILNYTRNFIPNYKTKRKSKKIENNIYDKFKSLNPNEKWFCNNLNFLTNNFKETKNIKDILEVGSYEGRSSIFFLKNFLNSNIICVDTWEGSDEHDEFNFKQIEKNFDYNTSNFQMNNFLIKKKMTSNEFFKNNKKIFDLIYVDGDHSSHQVKIDINNSWTPWWFFNFRRLYVWY